ncbi:hypothetical protein FGG08_005593 [Glutinoglossum americanum]|uniref:ABC transporter TMD0 domain-containing protein n=1 Tax=Glutinoglossum americanum TaxID=1670608 RepID=A0A9P8HY56_9PEZI|nr:hypothetical protein FGG08_005593 [Glutinoglossum americanum]
MALCSNRPEGFGPRSHLWRHMLTSCFIDTILEPLATWIYLLLIALVFFLPPKSTKDSPPPSHRFLLIGYSVLMFAVAGMLSVEIARLVLADFGVGLLPFLYVAYLVALVLRWRRSMWRSEWKWCGVALWVMLIVVGVVKIIGEIKEGVNTRKGTKYPMSDQVTDVGVDIGLWFLLAGLEAFMS